MNDLKINQVCSVATVEFVGHPLVGGSNVMYTACPVGLNMQPRILDKGHSEDLLPVSNSFWTKHVPAKRGNRSDERKYFSFGETSVTCQEGQICF